MMMIDEWLAIKQPFLLLLLLGYSRLRTARGSLQDRDALQQTCPRNQSTVVYCYLLMVEFNRKGTYNILVSNNLAAAAWICNV